MHDVLFAHWLFACFVCSLIVWPHVTWLFVVKVQFQF